MLLGAQLCFAQSNLFEIQVPEFSENFLDGNVIEVPVSDPKSVTIRLLNPVAQDIDYGQIKTKLNGQGAGYITTIANSAEGKLLRMNFALRAGMKLVPGTNTLEAIAVNRRGRRYYGNFILKTRDHARNEYFAYEQYAAPGDLTGAPPDILVLEPQFPIVFEPGETKRRVLVKGIVSTAHAIRDVKAHNRRWAGTGSEMEFEGEIEVAARERNVAVEAVDVRGNRSSVHIPVAGSDAGSPVVLAGGERYAIVIGISRYDAGSGLPDLNSASLDAQAFAGTLRESAGFKPGNILLLTDEQAKYAQLRNAIRNFAAQPGADDLLLIYFAGYGVHDPADPERIYLVGHDSQMAVLRDTALQLEDIRAMLDSNVRAKQTMLLFDVDRSLSGDWAFRHNNLVNSYLLQVFGVDAKRTVMVGSGVSERSRDEPGAGGLFTRQLIASTRGEADQNRDRVVTAREWLRFVRQSVRIKSGGAQNPQYATGLRDEALFY